MLFYMKLHFLMITNIDYWASYPDKNSDEMKGLFSDDGVYRTLNASGNKVWLDYITKYFTAN